MNIGKGQVQEKIAKILAHSSQQAVDFAEMYGENKAARKT